MSMGGVCALPFVWGKAWWIIRCTCSHYVITLINEKSLIYFSLHYCWKTALSRENFESCSPTGWETTSRDGVCLPTGVATTELEGNLQASFKVMDQNLKWEINDQRFHGCHKKTKNIKSLQMIPHLKSPWVQVQIPILSAFGSGLDKVGQKRKKISLFFFVCKEILSGNSKNEWVGFVIDAFTRTHIEVVESPQTWGNIESPKLFKNLKKQKPKHCHVRKFCQKKEVACFLFSTCLSS